jgi:hypothetical protein
MIAAYLREKPLTHTITEDLLIEMKAEISKAQGQGVSVPTMMTLGLGNPTHGITLETNDPLIVFLYEVARDHLDLQTMMDIAVRDRSHEEGNKHVVWRLSHVELADKVTILAGLLQRRVAVPEKVELKK